MAERFKFYRLGLPGDRIVGSTSVHAFPPLVSSLPPGWYQIDEVTAQSSCCAPVVATWGWVVKREDGSVALMTVGTQG